MSIRISNRRDFLKATDLVVAVLLMPGLRATATAVVDDNPNIAGNGQARGRERRSLFNIRRDPYEKNNLYAKHPEIVKELTSLLRRQMKRGYTRPMKDQQ